MLNGIRIRDLAKFSDFSISHSPLKWVECGKIIIFDRFDFGRMWTFSLPGENSTSGYIFTFGSLKRGKGGMVLHSCHSLGANVDLTHIRPQQTGERGFLYISLSPSSLHIHKFFKFSSIPELVARVSYDSLIQSLTIPDHFKTIFAGNGQ